jgi:hypothetical protein
MAQEVVSTISAAVAVVVMDRVVSRFLENFHRQMPIDKKLQQLELLLVRTRSTVEVSEKQAIKSTTLFPWQEKLKEAASDGDELSSGSSILQRTKLLTGIAMTSMMLVVPLCLSQEMCGPAWHGASAPLSPAMRT